MFSATQNITYGAVSKTLNRTSASGRKAEYYLAESAINYTLVIDHTVPSDASAGGESHIAKLTVNSLDAGGKTIRTVVAWTVIKTFLTSQDDTMAENTANALVVFTSPANVTKLVDREA